jgi:hemerythrin
MREIIRYKIEFDVFKEHKAETDKFVADFKEVLCVNGYESCTIHEEVRGCDHG